MSLIQQNPLWPLKYAANLPETKIRVLVAADDPALRSRLAATLAEGGHQVLGAGEGPAHLAEIAADPARWLAEETDVVIGALSTHADLEAITALKRAGYVVPLLLLAPSGPSELSLKAYHRGVDIVLSQRFDPEELDISVRALAPYRG